MSFSDLSQPGQFSGDFQTDSIPNGSDAPGSSGDAEGDFVPEHGTNGLDTIAEGKQNAKAVLAASGVSLPNADTSNGKLSPNSSSNNANGSASTRKRSRDGSVIRTSSPVQELPVRTRETPANKILLEQYVEREFLHSALTAWHNPSQELIQQKRAERDYYLALRRETHLNPAALYGVGYEGFGNPRTDLRNQHPQLLYPANRRRPGNRKTRELRVPRKDLKIQNEQIEDLVPIRLDIDWEKVKIRDAFTWNLHDRVVSPELFAEKLVEDLSLPLETCAPLVRMISQNIQEQLADYYPQIHMEEEPLDSSLPYTAYKNDEMRILVKLNITIGQHTLIDQFEWDINDPYNSPEEFAARMTDDLSLSGEFTTAIAHAIREQSQLFTKSLYIISHPFDGRPVDDPDLKAAFLPSPLSSSFRPFQAAKEFTPYLYELNEAELERTEVSISRDQRRQKRSVNRRGGPALPDLKDRQRTIRTMLVSSVIPNTASSIEESNVFKRSGSSRHRRAAVGQRDGGDESDESDSDESSMTGSPAVGPHLAQGTARTRGMRGAASAAHAALRASLAHSATPEPHHEPRVSARRRDYREESVVEEQEKLIVKLKIPQEKFRQFLAGGLRSQPPASASTPGPQPTSQSGTPQLRTPTPSTMAPPSQPKPQVHIPNTSGHLPQRPVQQLGAVDATHPPQPGVPGPPPPAWLSAGLARLNRSHPNDSFEGVMRYTAVDTETMLPVANANSQPGHRLKYQYLPRIRCHDCPGKLYTPGPGMTVDNFEVHLRNRQHKERVEERLSRAAAAAATSNVSS
ncbi:putative SWI-SNF complex subunit (Snf5) [Aspergillus clavatus NRRL 1]|uniref:SWI-SNF complex subunit (Snf5), putative n=1 Tax=Aspergillus clavatus (strain ATCC 1007 / CBS 513.65 / DSM 816 / NCTC 3887 / NRRL 1 / QM 1276 / 107) TaxID=344612 RepID=A1C817_ASPCL|nr:SWI-SNF complex subunit (Snf5), putative [Aspergillus clavatus NRRL 1]EAW14538.1 SWI-SNF complex subunit (Snf5), putative [Aspergillus clavatus NRRL 1]